MKDVFYKAFNKGMICNGKQYAENTDYEEQGADSCCKAGVMHFCEEPFAVWNYYPVIDNNGDFTEYAEVKPLDKVLHDGDKRASSKLHIGGKLSFKDFIKAEVDFIFEKAKIGKTAQGDSSNAAVQGYCSNAAVQGYCSNAAAQGDSSKAAAQGYCSKAAVQGNFSNAAAQGYCSKAAAQGYCSKAAVQGNFSKAAAQGDSSKAAAQGYFSNAAVQGYCSNAAVQGNHSNAAAQGDCSNAAAQGNFSKAAAQGYCSKAAVQGNFSKAETKGNNSIAASFGIKGKAKSTLGSWIVLAEWNFRNDIYILDLVKSAQIDGEILKPDTWYMLKNGEFTEVSDDESNRD